MKKRYFGLGIGLLICGVAFCSLNVSALTMEGTNYVNEKGAKLTQGQYSIMKNQHKLEEDIIEHLDEQTILEITDNDTEYLGYVSKYIKTTYIKDSYGNIITSIDEEITKEEADKIEQEQKSASNNKLRLINGDKHETDAKVMTMQYYRTASQTITDLLLIWKTVPKVQSYDVIALMYDKNVTFQKVTGRQSTNNKAQTYSYMGDNMNVFNNGVGISMNLFDNEIGHTCSIQARINNTSDVIPVYGTYQHAKVNVSLGTSKAYTLSPNGLGNVLNFNTSTIKGYYDGMQGLRLDHFNI